MEWKSGLWPSGPAILLAGSAPGQSNSPRSPGDGLSNEGGDRAPCSIASPVLKQVERRVLHRDLDLDDGRSSRPEFIFHGSFERTLQDARLFEFWAWPFARTVSISAEFRSMHEAPRVWQPLWHADS